MMDPGRFRWRFVVMQPVDVDDGAGGAARTYTQTGAFWAHMETLGRRAQGGWTRNIDASLTEHITYRLTARHRADLTTDSRLYLGAREMRVLSVQDAEPGFVTILAEELKP